MSIKMKPHNSTMVKISWVVTWEYKSDHFSCDISAPSFTSAVMLFNKTFSGEPVIAVRLIKGLHKGLSLVGNIIE